MVWPLFIGMFSIWTQNLQPNKFMPRNLFYMNKMSYVQGYAWQHCFDRKKKRLKTTKLSIITAQNKWGCTPIMECSESIPLFVFPKPIIHALIIALIWHLFICQTSLLHSEEIKEKFNFINICVLSINICQLRVKYKVSIPFQPEDRQSKQAV